ncbi:hypothetical protein LWI28_005458 [Acer negundo]|uniref:Large ribosomal subunit protein uL16m n=1 Tax=Acer negundo TaxID=4023 RepID=A0AAD5NTT7_ACENE|nr:hypothetical protein LWI28_005458 [Acer negundo]
MSGQFRRNGKIWVRVLADLPITGKPTEVRMGRGKGNPTGWIARVSTGQIPFEIDGVSLSNARQDLFDRTSAEVMVMTTVGTTSVRGVRQKLEACGDLVEGENVELNQIKEHNFVVKLVSEQVKTRWRVGLFSSIIMGLNLFMGLVIPYPKRCQIPDWD